MNDKLQSHYKSLSVNLPNILKLEGRSDTNLFAMSIKDILSTISGFSFSKARELNLFCLTVDQSHFLSRLNFEKDRSDVADVPSLVKTSLPIKSNIACTSHGTTTGYLWRYLQSWLVCNHQKWQGVIVARWLMNHDRNPHGRSIQRSWFHLNDLLCLQTLRITAQPDKTLWI